MPLPLLRAHSHVLTCSVLSLFNISKYMTFKPIARVIFLYINLPPILTLTLFSLWFPGWEPLVSFLYETENCREKGKCSVKYPTFWRGANNFGSAKVNAPLRIISSWKISHTNEKKTWFDGVDHYVRIEEVRMLILI